MKNRKYEVDRNNIYVGKVVREFYKDTPIYSDDKERIHTDLVASEVLRSIIFTVNDDGLSSDLLYNSPSYHIDTITEQAPTYESVDKEGADKSRIFIVGLYNLGKLLEFCNFNKNLTYDDIEIIRWTFFSKRFLQRNANLFGREYVKDNLNGHRYETILTSPLSEYFYVIDSHRDKTIYEIGSRDAFKPTKKEGYIKKLSRF